MSLDPEDVADLLEHARFAAGLTPIGLPAGSLARAAEAAPPPPAGAPAPAAPDPAAGEGDPALRAIREDLGDCRRCKLWAGRTNIVFGQGNPQAEVMFVGEAPGADEDAQGLAFVGRAGQLLTDIIEKGMKMRRSDVFIANILKCRPPENRNPEPDEVLQCAPFLERQIAAVRPRVIVALGKFAAHWVLRTAEPITRLRGRMGEFQGIPVMPTFHPAYLLRNPPAKKEVWDDIRVVLSLLAEPRA